MKTLEEYLLESLQRLEFDDPRYTDIVYPTYVEFMKHFHKDAEKIPCGRDWNEDTAKKEAYCRFYIKKCWHGQTTITVDENKMISVKVGPEYFNAETGEWMPDEVRYSLDTWMKVKDIK